MPDLSSAELQLALDVAVTAAKAAGERIRSYYDLYTEKAVSDQVVDTKSGYNLATQHKGQNPTDLVTELDRETEAFLKGSFSEAFPSFGFIGEETGLTPPAEASCNQPAYWIVDPIDGTCNFVHRVPHSCISIALVRSNVPLVAVVYEPVRGDLYTAIRGQGAWFNGTKRMRVSGCTRLVDALVATEFSGSEWRLPELHATLAKQRQVLVLNPVQGMRCLGSAALNLAMVAAGQLDIYFQYGIHAWDIAAGALLVQEAGGAVCSLNEAGPLNLSKRSIIAAATADLCGELKAAIAGEGAFGEGFFTPDPVI